MKKLLLLTLAVLLALPLYGCVPEWPKDTFYRADILAECDLSDLPMPKLENSRLGGEYLYCNLTQEEYETYVAELLAYLRGREDIHHLCYQHSRHLLAEIVPVDVCAPLPEDYDHTGDLHRFVFAYTEALGDDNRMADPIRISVIRETGTLFRTDFTYNTVIHLQPASSVPAELDYCAGEHTYDEGMAYPVPGLDREITVRYCIHCGNETRSEYFTSGGIKEYTITVSQGRNHIWGNNWSDLPWGIDSLYAGQILEITTFIPKEGTIELLVNGETIPVLRTAGDKQTFGFIMPEANVDIKIIATEQNG